MIDLTKKNKPIDFIKEKNIPCVASTEFYCRNCEVFFTCAIPLFSEEANYSALSCPFCKEPKAELEVAVKLKIFFGVLLKHDSILKSQKK